MRNNSSYIYRVFLALGDVFGLLLSFTAAYILRVTFLVGSANAPHVAIPAVPYITSIAVLLPFCIILFYLLGLYSHAVYMYRPRELGRLFIGAALAIVMMIAVSFFTSEPLFPSKLVPIYALVISFLLLFLIRTILRGVRLLLLDHGIGTQKLLLLGDNETVETLVEQIADNPRSGYTIVGLVTNRGTDNNISVASFTTLDQALATVKPDVIIQTDSKNSNTVYETAIDHHMVYNYIPTHKALATSKHSTSVVAGLPIITVHTTSLIGYGRFLKRFFDLIVSIPLVIILSPLMLFVAIAIKLGDPKGPVLMHGKMATRLTRFNTPFRLYKFRSHYAKFDGKTDEEVFALIGRPELIEEYRSNGDRLKTDFRVTPVGRVIRRFSLDELPQFFNVIKGDLSLVGPRALVPHELNKFEKWQTILSVKSGLTGLAIVEGRRTISFAQRRSLDVYYVQNWTFWLDLSILLRTVRVIFEKERS